MRCPVVGLEADAVFRPSSLDLKGLSSATNSTRIDVKLDRAGRRCQRAQRLVSERSVGVGIIRGTGATLIHSTKVSRKAQRAHAIL